MPFTPSDMLVQCRYMLATFVRQRRFELDLTIALACELTGMEFASWCALESGWIPDDPWLLRAIAGTLMTRFGKISLLATISRSHPATLNPQEN